MEENFEKGIIAEEALDEIAGGLNISKKALIATLASVGVAVVAASGVSYKIGYKSGYKSGYEKEKEDLKNIKGKIDDMKNMLNKYDDSESSFE